MGEKLTLLKELFFNPRTVSTVSPTSGDALKEITSSISTDVAQTIVEYGAGTGPITRGVFNNGLHPDSRYIAIEIVPKLAESLKENFSDPRLVVVHDTAENVKAILEKNQLHHADVIISGIPFSQIPPETRRGILEATEGVLSPNGLFIAYQFFATIRKDLEKVFDIVEEKKVRNKVFRFWLFKARHKAKPHSDLPS